MSKYEERTYREWVKHDDLIAVKVVENETDLLVSGTTNLMDPAKKSVYKYRKQLKDYIAKDQEFLKSFHVRFFKTY